MWLRNDSKSVKVGEGEHWLQRKEEPLRRSAAVSSDPFAVVVVGEIELCGDNFVRAFKMVGDEGGERARSEGEFGGRVLIPGAVGGRKGFQLVVLFQKLFCKRPAKTRW